MRFRGFLGLVECQAGWLAHHAGVISGLRRWRLAQTPGDSRGVLLAPGDDGALARSGSWLMVWRGRLHNRRELADDLDLDPGASAAAVAAAAFRRWRAEAPERLVGEFALAGYDRGERELVLARDHIGSIGLFFHQSSGACAFSTHMGALLDLPFVERRLDENRLADDLLGNGAAMDGTLWQGIDRVPSGGLVVIRPGAARRRAKYWQPAALPPIRFSRDEDYVEAARALLDQAVGDNLPAAGPVVCDVSGGLDSSAVAATAARLRPNEVIHTLTLVPAAGLALPTRPGWYADERPFVVALAACYPSMQAEFVGDRGPALIERDPDRLFQQLGAPMRNTNNAAWFEPSFHAAAERGAQMLLTGGQGNYSLSWSGMGRLAEEAAAARWRVLWHELRAIAAKAGGTPLGLLMNDVARYRHPRLHRLYEAMRGRGGEASPASPIAPDFARDTGAMARLQARAAAARHLYAQGDRSRRLDVFQAAERDRDHALAYQDALGSRRISPLFDRRLIEFCLGLPADQFLRNGQTRSFARRVLADRLPREVLENQLRGAQCPEWFYRLDARRHDLAETVSRLEASALARHCLDVPRLRKLLDAWPADAAAAQARWSDYHTVFGRGLHVGQFLMAVEAGRL
ncbi:asparagine synthetase B family protein [Ancylobacter sp. FA202]|uniref:asparagine synthase-related protein n=1 Tax=Ancylobacter sp. FA202 TaxID=1111106 RepID=UPI00036CE9D7|nr:asparagine synthetase B family protein [Ancylobacter sp. FA202]